MFFQQFDSKGPCGMTVNNDIDDDSATKQSDSHTARASVCRTMIVARSQLPRRRAPRRQVR